MTRIKIWLEENKSIIFENNKPFEDIVKEISKEKIYAFITKTKLSLAFNTAKGRVIEELKNE